MKKRAKTQKFFLKKVTPFLFLIIITDIIQYKRVIKDE
jgi:hypothetical protein